MDLLAKKKRADLHERIPNKGLTSKSADKAKQVQSHLLSTLIMASPLKLPPAIVGLQ